MFARPAVSRSANLLRSTIVCPVARPFNTAVANRKETTSSSSKRKASGPLSTLNSPASHASTEGGKFDVNNPQTTLITYDAVQIPQTKHGAVDVRTHTGQFWEESDYRLARFEPEHAQKLINKRFAIDLVNSVPPIERKERVVFCDGGGNPAMGHPKVFLNLDKPGPQACGYCGLRFVKSDAHGHH